VTADEPTAIRHPKRGKAHRLVGWPVPSVILACGRRVHAMTERVHGIPAARAVLASGVVVPTSDVLNLAATLERDSDGRSSFLAIATWLRALTEAVPDAR